MSEQGQLKGDIISWNGITGNKSFEDILDDVLDNTLKPNDIKLRHQGMAFDHNFAFSFPLFSTKRSTNYQKL